MIFGFMDSVSQEDTHVQRTSAAGATTDARSVVCDALVQLADAQWIATDGSESTVMHWYVSWGYQLC